MKKTARDIILHKCAKNNNRMRYPSWDRLRQIIFIILGHFLPFNPPTNQVNQNFEKWKKKKGLRGVIILHMCTKNQDMMYGSWDVKHGQIDFFVILNYFLSFYPPNKLKNQNFEKMKKKRKRRGDIIILHMYTIMKIIWCMVPEIWSTTDIIFCHFGPCFSLLPN